MNDKTPTFELIKEMGLLIGAFAAWFFWDGDLGLKIFLLLIFFLVMLQHNKPNLLLDRFREEFRQVQRLQTYAMVQLYMLRVKANLVGEDAELELPANWDLILSKEMAMLEESFDQGFADGIKFADLRQPISSGGMRVIEWIFEVLTFGVAAFLGWGIIWIIEKYQSFLG